MASLSLRGATEWRRSNLNVIISMLQKVRLLRWDFSASRLKPPRNDIKSIRSNNVYQSFSTERS
jgi:hypothetical protein